MPFSPDTVVADAIRSDPAVVDRLVALDPVFAKLRNPVLRKVMARLVRFRDAAKVAGVPLEAIMAAVNGEAQPASSEKSEAPSDAGPAPGWMASVDPEAAAHLDVRPILAAGDEPLGAVMRAAAAVPEGGVLLLEAPFDPVPLRRVLVRKGFVSHAEPLGPEHWRVTFLRDASMAAEDADLETDDTGAAVWNEPDGLHVDVRGLEPPQPMRAIVALIEDSGTGDTVTVHHEREPVFLYPELAERGWSHAIVAGEPGEVRLRLTRGSRQ